MFGLDVYYYYCTSTYLTKKNRKSIIKIFKQLRNDKEKLL